MVVKTPSSKRIIVEMVPTATVNPYVAHDVIVSG